MTGKQWAAIGTTVMVLAVGVRVGLIYKERRDAEKPAVVVEDTTPATTEQKDAYVYLKKKHQSSLADARELNGKRVWVSAGGQMQAYHATGMMTGHVREKLKPGDAMPEMLHLDDQKLTNVHVDYAKPKKLLLGVEPLDVVDFVEQKAPAGTQNRIPPGDRQVLMVFRRPADDTLLATPVGYHEGGQYTFLLDEIYFYDDPHKLYDHWPKSVWDAIEHHQVIKGMNELQTQLALGQVSTPDKGGTYGNRSVEYFNDNHPIRVTYADDKATKIEPQSWGERPWRLCWSSAEGVVCWKNPGLKPLSCRGFYSGA